MKFLFNKCRDCAGRFILAFCFSLRPDFLAEKNRKLCRIKRQKSARPFPSFSALALLLALPLLHWVAWSKANAASAATSLQGSSSQCSLSVWKREEMKLWERREKNSFLDWVDRGFVCMETMNVTAWYCCISRTNGVDLKIVNLFIAISIVSRVYNLLRGGFKTRRCYTEGFVRTIIEGLTQHSVVNISQHFPNNCWESSRVTSLSR